MLDSQEKQPNLESEINPRSIAIATTTFYPAWYPGEVKDATVDKIRGDLALQTIRNSEELGYQTVVVDGGSSDSFIERIKELGVSPQPEIEPGMSPSRQQVFIEASKLAGVGIICWVEPEKAPFIKDCLLQAVSPISRGEADVVIPKRDEKVLESYPDNRSIFERKGNKLFNEILRKHGFLPKDSEDLDVFFGPRIFRNDPEILEIFQRRYDFDRRNTKLDQIVKPILWPNALFLPIINILHRGFRVVSVEVPYKHPSEQIEIEKDKPEYKRKSDTQFKNILVSAMHLIRALEANPKSKIKKI